MLHQHTLFGCGLHVLVICHIKATNIMSGNLQACECDSSVVE